MKQKLISKLKRVALALFAALCVGNVWGRNAKFFFPRPEIDLTASGKITITGASVYLWSDISGLTCTDTLEYYIGDPDAENPTWVSQVVVPTYSCTKAGSWYGFVNLYPSPTLRGGYYEYQIPSDEFYVGCTVNVRYKHQLNKGVKSEIDYSDDGIVRDSNITQYRFNTAGVVSTKAEWTNGDGSAYIVSGETAGDGITKVLVKYEIVSINSESPTTLSQEAEATVENGRYNAVIQYDDLNSALVWSVSAFIAGEELEYEKGGKSIFRRNRLDDSSIMYTWKGGQGDWSDVENWGYNKDSAIGYPGTKGVEWYYSMVKFDGDANVDLGGGSFGFKDDGAFTFAENATVTFTNGHIYAASGHLGSGGSDAFGANGATIIFKNIGLYSFDGHDFSNKGCQEVTPQSNTTLIFEGDFNKNSTTYNDSSAWRYHPKKTYSDTKFIFKDGEIRCGYVASADYSMSLSGSHKVEITNATFRINTNMDGAMYGVADEVIFRDGVGDGSRQARLWIYNGSAAWDGNIKLPSVIDIKLPASPYSTAYIQAHSFTNTLNSTIKIDATDYVKGEKVPLIKLTEASTYIPTLKVFVNGEETTARNAKLVWEGNTLYYQQDSQNTASIGTTEYATLGEALEAAVSGDTVKLLVDVVAEKVVVVPTGATLDLNGKSIQALAVVGKLAMNGGALKTYDTNTQTYFFMAAPAQTVGALYWTSDAVMTIGADYTLSLDGGSVTLPNSWRSLLKQKLTIKNGATFVIPQGVELNLRGNAVVEEGATLTCEGTIALGNTYDAIDTSATLTSAQLAEGKVISAVEGYKVQYAGGQYTLVQDGYIVTTEPESSAVTVTADTEAEALAQVKFNGTPPEGVDAAVYENYFKLVATETAEGSKTWTVALALKDELKPVIAETTADDITKEAFVIDADGNVTLNISNKKPGLYYGVQVLKELGADPVAVVPETEAGALVVTADNIPDGNAAFFRVVVDFAPISVPDAE